MKQNKTKTCRRIDRNWTNRNAYSLKTRPSASAIALTCKWKRNQQHKLMKKQFIENDGSDNTAGDMERDNLDMEEQLTAFVEYNAADMDSLDIISSQDFDGDEEQDLVTQGSQHMQSNNWQDVTDVNQFQDETSQKYGNVICAPRSVSISGSTGTFLEEKHVVSRPFFLKKATSTEEREVHGPLSKDSEGSLSDGFATAINLVSAVMQP
ncbi:unnamed protein product [Peronospora belbahrii]|uniref:Uncharacterized protein n=1 Tax=Peronospora belbahrii TaxID=622444 RepID=A0ABN8D9H6_9STRA|nr:unnamed protein product [Peronospora belbahrii]